MSITITDSAQDYLAALLAKQEVEGIGVRVFVTQPGTPHAETCIAYCKPGESKPEDIVSELSHFRLYVDGPSESFLEDGLVDYNKDKMGGQLTIKAPNAKLPQISDDSSTAERIEYYIQTEINPGLASHGGQVNLVEIDGDVAVLQFGGGCQGCSSAAMTLNEGIEKTLLERVPELKGVRDVTDHSQAENAFYK